MEKRGLEEPTILTRQTTDSMPLILDEGRLVALRIRVDKTTEADRVEPDDQKFEVIKDAESAYAIFKSKEFIDDAMSRLGLRGKNFYKCAGWSMAIGIILLMSAFLYSIFHLPSLSMTINGQEVIPTDRQLPYYFTLKLISTLTIAGFFVVGTKFCFSLSKAYLHEAVRNFERRHALRFGWLYMELKGKAWDFTELKDAFQWNREATSAFRDIDLKHVSETNLSTFLTSMGSGAGSAKSKASEKIGEEVGEAAANSLQK